MTTTKAITETAFQTGELYLFHTSNPHCPPTESLWGIYHETTPNGLFLESYTADHRTFLLWQPLPRTYRFARRASRQELRDYTYNLALWECRRY